VCVFIELDNRKWPSYKELYANPAMKPFGTDNERVILCYSEVNEMCRSTHNPLPVAELHQNMLADFSRLLGAIGVFIMDDESVTGHRKLLHGLHNFPGSPGHSHDRMATMGFGGDVSGLDICTLVFDPTQLTITDDVIVPGTIDWV
jgi:hypothetical protein